MAIYSCKTWMQNCKSWWCHLISDIFVTFIFFEKTCHLYVDVPTKSKVVDMTWEGSYMGVLGKNGIVKVGALMHLLLCALKFVVRFFILVLDRISHGLHRKRHSFHVMILGASQVRSLPSWWRQNSANLCFLLSQILFRIAFKWKTAY